MNKPSFETKIHIQRLIDAFASSDKIERVIVKKGNSYMISNNIVCVQEGVFSVYMSYGNRLLTYFEECAIFGLANFFTTPTDFYIKPDQTSMVLTLETNEALRIVKERNLYESVNYVQAHNMTLFIKMYEKTISPNNYTFIRTLLMDLNQSSDAIKNSVTVASYIIKRSGLSRSYVMLVLSELKKGGYIIMEDGKLISITSLPVKF
ncbi:helix-turn-helix domain-containing protein [Budviciaceae bacterium BWR-B9]|uniref:Helix-turn-helix domain-containing protein n=1 Tax=Limnobaculum allomyrinae TaxID=2791986 RepID=A0ABS1INE4_9GAMM|nr:MULTISPECIES: helix-turn-helix domain-containing protein [Limnobaculum]MBK5143082.1 helix-turn-helix domain-containing protein [Limnobaculum allomyrinae]MBV7693412.1 helix-turn-helix domain-containing protein [Limnobaculum sp. M2-1]